MKRLRTLVWVAMISAAIAGCGGGGYGNGVGGGGISSAFEFAGLGAMGRELGALGDVDERCGAERGEQARGYCVRPVQVWEWPSDWKPEPNATDPTTGSFGLSGWEPVFHPVDANGFIYAPGAQGAIWKLNKTDGSVKTHITPTFSGTNVTAANTFVSSPLTADAQGNIYCNVIALNTTGGSPWGFNDVAGARLLKVTAGDTATMATYASPVPGAPAGNSTNCQATFFFSLPQPAFPWPPSSNPTPPPFPGPCGSQWPGVNVAPAVGADGTIYTVSPAHFDSAPSGVTNMPNSCLFGTTVGIRVHSRSGVFLADCAAGRVGGVWGTGFLQFQPWTSISL